MNAALFYEEFKSALNYLGVGFRGMADADVWIDGSHLCIGAGGKEAHLPLPSAVCGPQPADQPTDQPAA